MALLDLYLARFKPGLPYMTESELKLFKKLRESQTISFFRATHCVCGVEIYKEKRFCSKKCWEGSK